MTDPLASTTPALCIALAAALGWFSGCASQPAAPPQPEGPRVPINSAEAARDLAQRAQIAALQRDLAGLRASINGQARGRSVLLAAAAPQGSALPEVLRTLRYTSPGSCEAPNLGPRQPTAVRLARFDIRLSDQVLPKTLSRWAAADGYTLVWDSPDEPQITADGHVLAGDFRAALGSTIAALQQAGYPLRARIHPNAVVRVLPLNEATPAAGQPVTPPLKTQQEQTQ